MTIVRRFIAIFAATATLGCYTVRPVNLVENADASRRPENIDVTTNHGPETRIYGPVIRKDSLYGWYDEDRTRPATIGINEIVSARTRQLSTGRTVALLVGGGIVVIVTAYLILLATFINALGGS
jgi:hypothetical protein